MNCGSSQGVRQFAAYQSSNATQTGVAGQYSTTQAGGHAGHGTDPAGHEGHGHASILYSLADNPPNASQFIEGSLGKDAGKDFKLDKGRGFKDKKGRKPNGNDQKQNNLTEADANRPAYGIPKTVAGTNEKPNYVQDIQVSIGMGGLEALRPDVLQKLIDQQNAGNGSVWNGVAYLTGLIDQHDGSVTPELEAQRQQIMQTKVGGSGKTLAQWATDPKDSQGQNWARSNHAMTGIKAFLQMEQAGIPSQVANELANNDDMVSGAGRIDQIAPGRASNNQEGTFTGMNGDERKEWAKASRYARDLNRPDILRILMDSHTMGSHMLTQYGNKGAKSKINKNLGIDPNTPADQRKSMLVNYFLNNQKDPKKGEKAKGDLNGAAGNSTQAPPTQQTPPVTQGGGGSDVAAGGGAGAPEVAAGGGCAHDPAQGASLIGGGPADMGSIGAILQQLIASLNALVQALGAMGSVAGATGGGATQQTPPATTQQAPVPAAAAPQQATGGGATAHAGHAH